jgi:hypothetical protein
LFRFPLFLIVPRDGKINVDGMGERFVGLLGQTDIKKLFNISRCEGIVRHAVFFGKRKLRNRTRENGVVQTVGLKTTKCPAFRSIPCFLDYLEHKI